MKFMDKLRKYGSRIGNPLISEYIIFPEPQLNHDVAVCGDKKNCSKKVSHQKKKHWK